MSQAGRPLLSTTGADPILDDLCVVYSPTGQYLASSSRDGLIKVWDAQTGQPLRTYRVDESGVQSVAFSPDGRRLAAGCSDGSVKIWDLQIDKQVLDWQAHSCRVSCVAFSPDGWRLVSSCASYGWRRAP